MEKDVIVKNVALPLESESKRQFMESKHTEFLV